MPINAGDAACTQGLSGLIYGDWTGDTANNGFSLPLPAPATVTKSQCFQWASALATRLAAEAVYASAASGTGQSIPSGISTVVNMSTVGTDTSSAITIGSGWVFTVPTNRAGLYLVSLAVALNASPAADQILGLFKNGTEFIRLQRIPSNTTRETILSGTTVLNLAVADTIAPLIFQNSGGAVTLESSLISNWITITRLVGF